LIRIGIVEVISREILVEIFGIVLDLVTRELFVKLFHLRRKREREKGGGERVCV
jgi:hypothetical protein